MANPSHFPQVILVRHGETAWSLSGQHTGRTDIPLTPRGEELARGLTSRLSDRTFAHVLTSPLQRAKRTCELAGFGDRATDEPDLMEWDYGQYDGLTTPEILKRHAGWNVFDFGGANVGGESPEQMEARMERLVRKLRTLGNDGDVLCFGHAHMLRSLAARWLNLPITAGKMLVLSVATVSTLGYEHDLTEPVIVNWNT